MTIPLSWARVERMFFAGGIPMPWSFEMSPLDKTVDSLEWLARQMARDLVSGHEITAEDYRAVMAGIARVVQDLKPLQELRVQERRTID